MAWREYYLCEYSGSLGATSQGGKIPEMLSIKRVRLVILAQKGILIVARVRWKKRPSMIYVYVWKNTRNAFLKLDECGSCTKLKRYSLDALYARHGSRSCKNITRARERWYVENALAVCMKRPLAEHGTKHREIREEHQNYLPSNTHLEGKPSSKYYLRFTG